MRRILVAALALLLALCIAPATRASEPRVILISLDGATPAQIRDEQLTTLTDLRRRGGGAERLVPVFPTNTFPNHATLVTGVAPERHGIVNNVFLDPERGLHSYENDPSWFQVEPIWSVAARHGVVSAAYHWVGSQGPWTSGLGPRHWEPFDPQIPEATKVDQILAWLDLEDPNTRPRLITSWFHGSDRAGHRHGPASSEVRAALRSQDAELGRLVAGLEARGLVASTTLLLVSDHGMAPVERSVDLAAALERAGAGARVLGGGGFATLSLPEAGDPDAALRVARRLGLEAHRRERAPADWRLGNPRFGDVAVLTPPGTAIASGRGRGPLAGASPRGAHGHRAGEPSMGAIFIAFGRGVAQGASLGEVRALDVAPTALALLGLPVPGWMEGEPIRGIAPAAAPALGTAWPEA